MATSRPVFSQHQPAHPDRRTFVKVAAAGATLPLTAMDARAVDPRLGEDLVDTLDDTLVDAHVHVWTPDTRKYPLASGYTKASMKPPSFTPQELMAHAKPAGVGRVVLIQMSYYGFDNSYMLDVMQQHAGVYSGVAVIDEEANPARVMKRLRKQGVRGFRIRPQDRQPGQWLNGPGMKAMWKTGADENLAMCHLINPEFLPSVERMCGQFKSTPVVIDHFARIGIDGKMPRSELDNLCRLSRFENVTVKVSAYYALGKKKAPYRDLGPMIKRLLGEFGAQRLMWASDCPFQVVGGHRYAPSIDLIKTGLDFLNAEDKQWILGKTADRVFFP